MLQMLTFNLAISNLMLYNLSMSHRRGFGGRALSYSQLPREAELNQNDYLRPGYNNNRQRVQGIVDLEINELIDTNAGCD